ncbi:MAG: ribonuclease HII [Thermoanaerobaculia bacterium]|nr:ribonuclease HII [Thermoanaerobaculia bacterium]
MTLEPLLAEACRLHLMRGLEGLLFQGGYCRVAGVDEAGRGALAGPVVVAAVIMPPEGLIPGIDDSKALPPEAREALAALVRRQALAVSVASSPAAVIDRINVLAATRDCMRRALLALDPAPDMALIDAVSLSDLPFRSLPLIRGDATSYAIACASLIAKVERDRQMCDLGGRHPQYGFERNKGYGAAEHLAALREYGPIAEHRLTFRSVLPRQSVAAGAS